MSLNLRSSLAALLAGASIAGSELLFARLLLPATGGGPGVFLPVLLLFAAVFPFGAELSRRIGRSPRLYLPLALLAITHAFGVLLLGDPLSSSVVAPTVPGILMTLLWAGGPLLLLLSATVPLLSSSSGGVGVVSASNGGALLGLVVGALGEAVAGLSLLRLLLLVAGVVALLLVASLIHREAPDQPARSGRAAWPQLLLLAMVASSALGATSTMLTADLGGVPMLWALALGAYFLAWSIAFSPHPLVIRLRSLCERLAPAGALAMMVSVITTQFWSVGLLIALLLGSLFILSVALLARIAGLIEADRQSAAVSWRVIGIGGALGAVLTSIVAPLLLTLTNEISLVGAAGLIALLVFHRERGHYWPALVGVVAIVLASPIVAGFPVPGELYIVLIGGVLAINLAAVASARVVVTALTLILLVVANTPAQTSISWQSRSLLGPLLVIDESYQAQIGDISASVLVSGRTIHGSEITAPAELAGEPTTFYHRLGPLGDLMTLTPTGSVAVIGMGAGTMAAYASPERPLLFVELDPAVIEVARTRFHYLEEAGRSVEVLEGEGRRWLSSDAPGGYAMIVIDAFNGDAVPTHLLTAEALRAVALQLRPSGIIAIHISSRIFDLAPAIGATAASLGLETRGVIDFADPSLPPTFYSSSEWVVIGATSALTALPERWQKIAPGGVVLSDDRVDLLALLRR
jgi:spermidine synthase